MSSSRRLTRTLLLLAVVLSAATAILAIAGGKHPASGSSDYRVDAIFDTAKGIIPGQVVKVAGARVGTIEDVKLTPDFKARIEMRVDGRFAPFRTDATCSIQPEGLISENFVQCDPGSPAGRSLTGTASVAPTVAASHNTVPISINDLFNVWRTPVRQRLSVILAAIGAGAAGHGEDLNTLLRRANPTLALVRKLTTILDDQRTEVSGLVRDTDRVVAQLGKRSSRVADFIDQASRVTTKTGDRHTQLAEAVRRLPGLLDATRPALDKLNSLAASGTPVLRNVRRAAPSLNNALSDLRPFATAATPALVRIGRLGVQGTKTAKTGTPLVGRLRKLADTAKPAAIVADTLFANLRDKGALEGLLDFLYYVTASTSRYDSVSHMLPAELLVSNCAQFATAPVAGCNAGFGPDTAAPKGNKSSGAASKKQTAPASSTTPAAAPPQKVPARPAPLAGVSKLLQPILDLLPKAPEKPDTSVKDLLGYLLK